MFSNLNVIHFCKQCRLNFHLRANDTSELKLTFNWDTTHNSSFIYFIFCKSNTGNDLGCGNSHQLHTIVVKIQQSHNCITLRT
jgi:uncharacterized protein involved in tellurium resistance